MCNQPEKWPRWVHFCPAWPFPSWMLLQHRSGPKKRPSGNRFTPHFSASHSSFSISVVAGGQPGGECCPPPRPMPRALAPPSCPPLVSSVSSCQKNNNLVSSLQPSIHTILGSEPCAQGIPHPTHTSFLCRFQRSPRLHVQIMVM